MFGRNARPVVNDGKSRPRRRLAIDVARHRSSGRGELDGVVEKVHHRLAHMPAVGKHANTFVARQSERQVLLLNEYIQQADGLPHECHEGENRGPHGDLAGIRAR